MADQKQVELPVEPGAEFLSTIVALRGGAVLAEIGERLNVVVSAVRATDKSGSLTLTLKVSPVGGTGEVVVVEADIKEKVPRPSLGTTAFFTTEDGMLARKDPRQLELKMQKEN